MKTCYKCGSNLANGICMKEGVKLGCLRCPKCREEFFTSSEIIKFDVATGRRQMVRKFGTLGDSTVMRFPPKIVRDFKIKPGDYGVFEERPDGILIRLVKAEDI